MQQINNHQMQTTADEVIELIDAVVGNADIPKGQSNIKKPFPKRDKEAIANDNLFSRRKPNIPDISKIKITRAVDVANKPKNFIMDKIPKPKTAVKRVEAPTIDISEESVIEPKTSGFIETYGDDANPVIIPDSIKFMFGNSEKPLAFDLSEDISEVKIVPPLALKKDHLKLKSKSKSDKKNKKRKTHRKTHSAPINKDEISISINKDNVDFPMPVSSTLIEESEEEIVISRINEYLHEHDYRHNLVMIIDGIVVLIDFMNYVYYRAITFVERPLMFKLRGLPHFSRRKY